MPHAACSVLSSLGLLGLGLGLSQSLGPGGRGIRG